MTDAIRVHAKKSLGQNWLNNPGVLDRIVQAAGITPTDTVVEVGPGQGALTERLANTGARVVAIEKDVRLIEPLRERFPKIEIIEADILTWKPEDLGSYKVVANIPYYLTSHLIRLMLEEWPSPALAVLMVQEEVARRMVATPPDMNLLALSVQLYAKPEIIMKVSRGSFRPVPNVDSAVIRLEVENRGPSQKEHAKTILALAKKAFEHKRKQLKSSIDPAILERANISPEIRPQELSVENWSAIARELL
jgi:16S rRNA (adenine1518-N6/adenine1519-N6)-dimethyltransferase